LHQRLLAPARAGLPLGAAQYGWLALAFLLLTIYGSLIPLNFQARPLAEALSLFSQIAYFDPSELGPRGDWVVSVVLFAALSYLLMATRCVDRPWVTGLGWALLTVPCCVALSVAIEFVQIYFPPRTVSLNDIAVESLGGLAGALTWLACGQQVTRWLRRLSTVTGLEGLAGRILPAYICVLLVVQLMPFDLVVSSGELEVKYEEGRIWLVPFQHAVLDSEGALVKLATTTACFFPLGFLKLLSLRRVPRTRRSWSWVVLYGLGITVLVEFLKLFVYSRYCDTTDILTGTVAIVLGWRAGRAFRDYWQRTGVRGRFRFSSSGRTDLWRPRLFASLFLAWLALVLFLNWQPFDFTTDPALFTRDTEELPLYGLRRITWVPLADYYWGSKYHALDQFVQKSLSFLPLGILWALALHDLYRRSASFHVALTALVIATVIETGRYFLPSHGPSVADILIQCSGAWIGFRVTRHVRATLWAETLISGWNRPSRRSGLSYRGGKHDPPFSAGRMGSWNP